VIGARWRAALRSRKLMASLALVVVLIAVAVWPEAAPVDLAAVERGPLQVTVEDEGETRVRERFVISAPVTGRLRRIELEPADPVQRGQVVAVLQPVPPALLDARTRAEAAAAVEAARAARGRTQAERARAQAAAAQAASELKRQSQLAKSGIASAEALERARTEAEAAEQALRAAQFAVASAEHELERAQAALRQASGEGGGRDVELRSPVAGTVLRRLRESEAVVPAGEPLLEVGDPRQIEIVTDLLSADAVKVRAGQPVLIEQWGGDVPLRGRVRHVEPSGFMKVSALGVEEQRVNVIVDFEDPKQAEPLGDGYRVEVRIVVWEAADVLKAPTSSLFRRGEDWAVFVAEGGRARLRRVQIGRRSGLEAQVLGGLQPGERVIVHPADTLGDGQRVAPRG
jgi:HlyD family secretion protein